MKKQKFKANSSGFRRLPGVVFFGAMLVLVGYALMPWWLPVETVKEWLTKQMQQQLGRGVSIGKLSVDWLEGVQIRDLRVGQKSGFATGLLACIGRVQCPFEPIQLVNSKLGKLQIQDVDLYVVVKEDGQVNLGDLKLPRKPQISGITVKRCRLHLSGRPARTGRFDQISGTSSLEGEIEIVDGAATILSGSLRLGDLSLEGGGNGQSQTTWIENGKLSGDFRIRFNRAAGTTEIDWLNINGNMLAERIDVDELKGLFDIETDGRGTKALPEEFAELLRLCEMAGSIQIERLGYTDGRSGVRLCPEQLHSSFRLRGGKAEMEYRTAINGGVVTGHVQCDLNQPDPVVYHSCVSTALGADDALRAIVESKFPGLEVGGTINEIYQLSNRLSTIGDLFSWSGSGRTTCTDGLLYGPGGPGWLLKVVPGLKEVEYSWWEMTNEYERFSDGRGKNRMRFRGKSYDIYIDGLSSLVREPQEYDEIMKTLEEDLRTGREKLAKLEAEKSKLSSKADQRLRRRVEGLAELSAKYQAGRKPYAYVADYEVGTVVKIGSKDLFESPAFRSHSYIVGQFMVGIVTTNAGL